MTSDGEGTSVTASLTAMLDSTLFEKVGYISAQDTEGGYSKSYTSMATPQPIRKRKRRVEEENELLVMQMQINNSLNDIKCILGEMLEIKKEKLFLLKNSCN